MRYVDGHCDVLTKLWESGEFSSFHAPDSNLDVSYVKAKQANYLMQSFAIFVPPQVHVSERLSVALTMIDVFNRHIVKNGQHVKHVLKYEHIAEAQNNGCLAALLLLEGAEAVQGNLHHLRILHKLGVRSVGLTWNNANEVADGAEEERGGGLTRFGRQFVNEMTNLNMLLDVSHLSRRGFWDVLEQSEAIAVHASHSNARSICRHPRNLDDSQIKALLARDGVIGLTFVPWFLEGRLPKNDNDTRPEILLRHIDHICALGGVNHIAFGSDFDGFTPKLQNLSDARDVSFLTELLLKHYKEDEVKGFLSRNWLRYFRDKLV